MNTHDQQTTKRKGTPPSHIIYHVADRDGAPWTRIGAAWPTKSKSGLRLQFDLVPIAGGTITLQPNEAEGDRGEGGQP